MKNFILIMVGSVIGVMLGRTDAYSQEIGISDGGSYEGCAASIVDTGGNSGEYGNNENIVFTVCPEEPETIVALFFPVFNLGEGDVMNIYSGIGAGGTLIGSFTGSDLGSQSVSSLEGDGAGCLTVEFISDAQDTGDFAFVVSCGPPCEYPVPVVDVGSPLPLLVCVDEEITFDGTASVIAPGAELESYTWDFGDGTTDNSSGLVVTHSYDQPGEYVVQLHLTDDNDCSSIMLTDVSILVSTEPDFENTTDSISLCLGQEIELTGVVEGTLWNGQPSNPIGGYLEIPDDQSQCFSSEIIFSNFPPGSEVGSANDFESVFVNMEHSYMGDLVISLICPSGEAMVLHQQGGASTFLGEPNDPDVGMEIEPGVGYDYWWAPDAENGTWASESSGFGTLPSDTYSSVDSFDELVGCPMNGVWTLQICDLFGADNGVVFDWTLFFDPSLYPDITNFTPTFGNDCDSTYWSEGEFITSVSEDCNNITVAPTELGTYTYTYFATDNHGCTYEHFSSVTVEQGPLVDIPDQEVFFCGEPVQIFADASNADPDLIYSWSPAAGLSNPNVSNPFVMDISEDQTFTVTVYHPGEEVCGSTDSVFVEFVPPVFSTVDSTICAGVEYELPGGSIVTEAGTYVDTLQIEESGCDSVVTTTITHFPTYLEETTAVLCGDDFIVLPNDSVVDETGVYTVTLPTVDGCDSTIVTTVTTISVNPGEYPAQCSGQLIVNISGSSTPADPEASLTWSGPDELSFENADSPNTQVTIEEGGVYTIELTDSRCPEDPASTVLTLLAPPEVETTTITDLCVDESRFIELELSGNYASPPYVWMDSLGLYSLETGSGINIVGSDFDGLVPYYNYQVEVLVPGIAPCPPAFDTVSFNVIDCEIIIPNIFTPNGDGVNESFEISGIQSFPNSRLLVLNRWGKVVYESENYGNPYWNGTHYESGAELADGIYYYELIVGRINEAHTGTITILRD